MKFDQPSVIFSSNAIQILISGIASILSTRYLISSLGQDNYGLFVLLSSVMTYIMLLGFGIDSATGIEMNKASTLELKYTIFNTAKQLSFIIGSSLVIFFVFFKTFNISNLDLFFLKDLPSQGSLDLIFNMIFLGCFSIFINVYASGLRGLYLGPFESVIQSLFAINLAAISYYTYYAKLSISDFSYLYLASCVIILSLRVPTLSFFSDKPTRLNTKINFNKIDLVKLGFFCSIGSISTILIANIDNIFLAKFVDLESVAIYSLCFKLITIACTALYAINSSFIPQLGICVAEKNTKNLHNLFLKIHVISISAGLLFSLLLLTFGRVFIYYWVDYEYPIDLILPFSLYIYFFSIGNAQTIYINSIGAIRGNAAILLLEAVIKLTLSSIMIQSFFSYGAIYSTLFSYFLCSIVLLRFQIKRISCLKLNMKRTTFELVPIIIIIATYNFFNLTSMNIITNIINLIISVIVSSVFYLSLKWLNKNMKLD